MKRAAWAAAVALALTGCTQSVEGEGHWVAGGYGEPDEWNTPTPDAPSTVSQPPQTEEAPKNARGNYEAVVGEQQDVVVIATGAPVFSFTVTAITPGLECAGSYSSPPENGQYVGITMTFTTVDLSELGGNLYLSSYDFQVIGTDGSLENNSASFGTYSCLPDSEQFPVGGIGQGVTASATFVVDTKHAAGFIVFRPGWLGGGGWEYQF